jgi:hypothetical protein
MSIDQKETNKAKNELMSLIYSAWLYIFFIGKLLVMGSTIINLVLICSIDHFMPLNVISRTEILDIDLLLLLLFILIKEKL